MLGARCGMGGVKGRRGEGRRGWIGTEPGREERRGEVAKERNRRKEGEVRGTSDLGHWRRAGRREGEGEEKEERGKPERRRYSLAGAVVIYVQINVLRDINKELVPMLRQIYAREARAEDADWLVGDGYATRAVVAAEAE